ncbi:MAG: TetR/AcrR family transcriptional regulator [Deltaproteobacteria bacterium]|nr:TetR/AcrR family transcriptional regulator [Deltaproteobacteria bacterium]
MGTRDKILTQATAHLKEVGLARLSLRQIAVSVGIKAPSIYEHFRSKEEIIDAIRENAAQSLTLQMTEAALARESPEDSLIQAGVAYVLYAITEQETFQVFFQLMRTKRRTLTEKVSEDSPYSVISGLFVEYFKDRGKTISQEKIEELSYGYWSLIHGAAVLRTTFLKGFKADFEQADTNNFHRFLLGSLEVI